MLLMLIVKAKLPYTETVQDSNEAIPRMSNASSMSEPRQAF
jgi:hypothetical protein